MGRKYKDIITEEICGIVSDMFPYMPDSEVRRVVQEAYDEYMYRTWVFMKEASCNGELDEIVYELLEQYVPHPLSELSYHHAKTVRDMIDCNRRGVAHS